MAKKNVLGRGIESLIRNDSVEQTNDIPVSVENYEIEISKIKPNPDQPRTSFDEKSLKELADSIKVHGVIQPLTLRETAYGEYQIISGERRFRAAKLAGLTTVPSYIRTANDQETLEMALIENTQREDLNSIEIALTYKRLIDECKLTQDNLSERLGKGRSTITNYLRLLSLEDEIQQSVKDGKISMGHAKPLLGLDAALQKELAKKIVDEELSVRQVEEMVQNLSHKKESRRKSEKPRQEELPEKFGVLLELLDVKFNNKIQFKRNKNGEGGSIVISYTSDKEIETFIQNLSV
jgi:ParB family chromosome partitioning protein